jgi:hypothetical protein
VPEHVQPALAPGRQPRPLQALGSNLDWKAAGSLVLAWDLVPVLPPSSASGPALLGLSQVKQWGLSPAWTPVLVERIRKLR